MSSRPTSPAGVQAPGAAAQAEIAEEVASPSLIARWVLQEFDAYYYESRNIPSLAKGAFERRDPATTVELSRRRLSMYSVSMNALALRLKEAFPGLVEDESVWAEVERHCLPTIASRYESDLAYAYLHSVRRRIYRGEWRPVDYSFAETGAVHDFSTDVCRAFPGGAVLTPETMVDVLELPGFSTPWRNLREDAQLVAARVNETLELSGGDGQAVQGIEMINAGFYRNRGAYLVGRILLHRKPVVPFIIALLNEERGVYVDAVMLSEADAHNIFSSTMANFHVTNKRYHELAAFLHTVMPRRPLGLHYSTIGFNHIGKVAVMNELKRELAGGDRFTIAVGNPGTVAIGFSSPHSAYNLKVIRDKPTAGYKWGEYPGQEVVLKKYSRVHEINRTGSMLDNIIYYNLKLDRDWFAPELLDELLSEAGETVFLRGDAVLMKYLIVQRRMTPLPVFLENASPDEAAEVIVNLGHCIKNNGAANVFNKDLDARNYGVSRHLKVYLFDYDALEPLTEVKVHTNVDRCDGEEDVPDWFFEEGTVFLPEEIEANLFFPTRDLRRLFREVHGDLLTASYWEGLQRDLMAGNVPSVVTYPDERKLRR